MPHVAYPAANVLCPWPGCEFQIALVDFQVELRGDPALYARVMVAWGHQPGFGLVAACPGCGRYVCFGPTDKLQVSDPNATGLPVLPDDWHHNAIIV